MSVPPSGRRPSSTPPGKGRPDDDDSHKDFKLPPKKQPVDAKEEEAKKKGLFDVAAEKLKMEQKQQSIAESWKAEQVKASSVTAADAAAQVSQVARLIQSMVASMRVGEIDSQNFASLELKKGPEVPEAFSGAHLTINYVENGLVIHFDNFLSPQQQNTAITLVEKNKEQLEQMVLALNAKNIQVNELSIGTHTVALPRVQPLPPPFQPTRAPQTETEQQRRDQERGGDREGGSGEPR